MADIASEIRRFLANRYNFGDGRLYGDDDPLLDAGIIDSMGVLELITHLEESYGIKIGNDELVPENLDTISRIRAFLEKKTS